MFRFGDSLIGGTVTSADDDDFTPGGEYRNATLDLWGELEQVSIAPGSSFTVWYGEDVGEGTVTALTASA